MEDFGATFCCQSLLLFAFIIVRYFLVIIEQACVLYWIWVVKVLVFTNGYKRKVITLHRIANNIQVMRIQGL